MKEVIEMTTTDEPKWGSFSDFYKEVYLQWTQDGVVAMADEPTGADVEKTVIDVLDHLTHNRINKGVAEQIVDKAKQSISRQTRDGGLHDAIIGGPRRA